MSKINDIHDGTFKDILKYKDTARNLLKVTLPEEIYNSIDFSKGITSVNTEKRGLKYKKKLLDAALQVTLIPPTLRKCRYVRLQKMHTVKEYLLDKKLVMDFSFLLSLFSTYEV